MLTWFLLSAYIVILGAELDVEIRRTQDQGESPRGGPG